MVKNIQATSYNGPCMVIKNCLHAKLSNVDLSLVTTAKNSMTHLTLRFSKTICFVIVKEKKICTYYVILI